MGPPYVTAYRSTALSSRVDLSPKARYSAGLVTFTARAIRSTSTPSYPCSQNISTARSSASSRTKPFGRPGARFVILVTIQYETPCIAAASIVLLSTIFCNTDKHTVDNKVLTPSLHYGDAHGT